MSKKQRRHKMAKFQDLASHLGRANLDVETAAQLLADRGPKKRSIERLIGGHSIRLYSAYRLGHLVNKYLSRSGQEQLQLNAVILPA